MANEHLDLLIVDIDDTFLYHRTVAVANKLFLGLVYKLFRKKLADNNLYTTRKSLVILFKLIVFNFFRFKFDRETLKNIFKLSFVAIRLHFIQLFRQLNNPFFGIISSERLISIWANAIVSIHVKASDYNISSAVIKSNLDNNVRNAYNFLRKSNPKMKVVALTQSFSVGVDPIKKVLGFDFVISNKFVEKKGFISGFELNIKDGFDKKKIAEKFIKKFKSKSIGLFVDDYDDVGLLSLKNLSFVLYKKRLKRFMKFGEDVKTESFR